VILFIPDLQSLTAADLPIWRSRLVNRPRRTAHSGEAASAVQAEGHPARPRSLEKQLRTASPRLTGCERPYRIRKLRVDRIGAAGGNVPAMATDDY
jgi:hypothetical protein